MEKGWIVLRGQGYISGNGRGITHSRHGGKAIVQDAVFVYFLQGVSVWEIVATAPIYEDNRYRLKGAIFASPIWLVGVVFGVNSRHGDKWLRDENWKGSNGAWMISRYSSN